MKNSKILKKLNAKQSDEKFRQGPKIFNFGVSKPWVEGRGQIPGPLRSTPDYGIVNEVPKYMYTQFDQVIQKII